MLTVITPADNLRLTTLDQVKTELQLSARGDDAYLTGLIDHASAMTSTWCGRTFALETIEESIRPTCSEKVLMLSRWPVASVASIVEAGTTLTAADYELNADQGTLYRLDGSDNLSCWSAGKIVATYDAGYVLPGTAGRTLPLDIERAVLSLIKAEFFARTRDPMIRSEDIEGVLRTDFQVGGFGNKSALTPDAEALLSQFRQPTIG